MAVPTCVLSGNRFVLVALPVLLGSACGEPTSPSQDSTPPVPNSLRVVSGDAQVGQVGELLEEPVTVEILDQRGAPLVGAVVLWSTEAGSGQLMTQGRSDAEGRATARWRLGTGLGTHLGAAAVSPLVVQLEASAIHGPPSRVHVVNLEDGFLAPSGEHITVQVEVSDSFGHPAKNIVVNWVIASGDGDVLTETTSTDSVGIAATEWVLAAVTGEQRLLATVAGGPLAELWGEVAIDTLVVDAIEARTGDTFEIAVGAFDEAGTELTIDSTEFEPGPKLEHLGGGRFLAVGWGLDELLVRVRHAATTVPVDVKLSIAGSLYFLGATPSSLPTVTLTTPDVTTVVHPSADGRFQIEPENMPAADSVDILIDGGAEFRAAYHSSMLRMGGDSVVFDPRILLIPKTFTIPEGTYAGRRLPVDLVALTTSPDRESDRARGFITLWGEGHGLLTTPNWAMSAFPIRLALIQVADSLHWTREDSARVQTAVDRLETSLGLDVFVLHPNNSDRQFQIRKWWNRQVAGTCGGGGGSFLVEGHEDFSIGVVNITASCFDDTIPDIALRVILHEVMHGLGFGHHCQWNSPLFTGCSSASGRMVSQITAEDAGYMWLVWRVRERMRAETAQFGLPEAVQGERVLVRGLARREWPPCRPPACWWGSSSSLDAAWGVAREEPLLLQMLAGRRREDRQAPR